MGNLTHVNSQRGPLSEEWITEALDYVHKTYFNKAVVFVPRPEFPATLALPSFHGSWMLRDKKKRNVFDFYLEFPACIGFYYSHYGIWGDWARLITIETLAVKCDGVIWDDATGRGESWKGEPEKYETFEKFVKQRLSHIPWGARTIYRGLARASKPRGAA